APSRTTRPGQIRTPARATRVNPVQKRRSQRGVGVSAATGQPLTRLVAGVGVVTALVLAPLNLQ
ncbi:MAG: hypothetical protein WCB67_04770, partial [Solirubrobacteraceae bacterium]